MKAADILAVSDLKTDTVEVPEWNTTLTIRELGLDEGIKLFSMAQQLGDKLTLNADDICQVIAWGVVDEKGQRVFSDKDVAKLAQKSRAPLMRLYSAITALSGEDAEKN